MNAPFEPLKRFIKQDPELDLRVLTSKKGPVRERMIEAARELLAEEVNAGNLTLARRRHALAYLFTPG